MSKARRSITALTVALVAAAGVMLWGERGASRAPSMPGDGSAEAAAPKAHAPAARTETAPRSTVEPVSRTVRTDVLTVPRSDSGAAMWSVRVVDPSRRPIPGARVDLVEIRPASDDGEQRRNARRHRSERSDEDGIARFVCPQDAERYGIVAAPDGWLRTTVEPPISLVDDAAAPLVVVLRQGGQLRGRVVDPRGQPVPDLDLLAVTASSGVGHVSLSSVALRADARFRDPRNADHQQSRATTSTDGSVVFDGVPGRTDLEIRSDDPAWRIVGPELVAADVPPVTWTAAPAIGVVVRVLDPARRPVPAAATFRVDLDLADGSRRDIGQWVGKGNGSVRFSFHAGLFPPLTDLDVLRATFHGTVTTNAGTESWRSTPILNPAAGGVVELEVRVSDRALADGPPTDARPSLQLVLDVLGGDGQPYTEPLVVAWSSSTRAESRRGEASAELARPGIYRTAVPVPGDVASLELRVQPRNASGSLPPWTATVPATPDRQQTLSVRLAPAGSVVILRPVRWTTAWTVRASYRDQPGEPWQGSWTYGTADDRLTLTSLRPAQWRFELVQESPARAANLETPVRAGDQLVIGG